LSLLVAFFVLSLGGGQALGQTTYSWSNVTGSTAPTTLWSASANWGGGVVPTFNQDATLTFAGSDLQTAGGYMSTNDGDVTVNSLVFSMGGNFQGLRNGTPLILNAGNAAGNTIRLATSSTGAVPSIVQNGNGSVTIQAGTGGALAIEGANPLTLGGTGLGLLQLDAPITAGPTSGTNAGLLINFAPSAVRPFNTGASVVLSGSNTFTGDVVLQNGSLDLASNTALGAATNRLVVNAGSNSLRVNSNPTSGAFPTIGNNIVLNSSLTFTNYDGATSTFTGNWSGAGGLTVQGGPGMTLNLQGAVGFNGPLIIQSWRDGSAGTANNVNVNVNSSTGGALNGTLGTTDIRLFPGAVLTLNNANANQTRLAAGTNLTMVRSTFALTANASVNAAETVATLTNTGMSTILVTPGASSSATLTFGSWTRQGNSTAYFVGTGLGGTPGSNVANIVFTADPGGETPGSTTAGSQNLAVLPYAYGNSASSGNFLTSLVRYDATTGRITPLNTATEYASNAVLAAGTGAPGLNYRLAGSDTGGVAALNGSVSLNGLVLDSNMASPAPKVGVALVGPGTLNLTGPVLSTFSGSGFPTTINTFLPNQIAVGGLAFGANTAYFHTPGDLWVLSPISGSGGLVKSGENGSGQANLYLMGANTFTGGLTINAGQVLFDSDANLGAAGAGITLNSAGNGGLTYSPNLYYGTTAPTALTIDRPLTIGAAGGSLIATNSNSTFTYAGAITGTGGLIKQGVGTVVVNNSGNNFTGDVVILSGTLVAGSDAALGAAGNRVIMSTLGGSVFQPGAGFTSTNRDFYLPDSFSGNAAIFTNGVNFTINGTLAQGLSNFGGSNFVKGGLGTLTLTAASTLTGAVTIGDTTIRVSAPAQAQIGGALRLSGANGSLALASGFTLNDGASLILDNTAAVNNERIGTVGVSFGNGGSLVLLGNSAANVSQRVGALTASSVGTVTLTQPASSGGQVTTLTATGLSANSTATLFVRGTNLGATTGDRTQLIVTPGSAAALTVANGIVVGAVGAASDTSAPTDFLAATPVPVSPPAMPTQYSLAPLTTYGSLAAPGSAVNANQAGGVFTLSGPADLNALRIGTGGGLDLNGQTLTLGTTTANARAGMILAAGGANAGIVGGAIDFSAQVSRFVTTNDLTIGTAANPTTLTGTSPFVVKSGPGTLTLFGTPATTLGTTATGGSGSVQVGEGTLALGNANALGTTTFSLVPGTFPSITVQQGATLDLTALSAAPVRINTVSGAGTIALGSSQLNTGNSSSAIPGNLTGGAGSKFIVGVAQSEAPLNTFGGGGPTLTGDNSGFLGQFEIFRGTIRFASNLSFGGGTAPILFGDTATGTSTGTVTLAIDSALTVPFPRDVVVQAGNFAVPTLLAGNSINQSMTGNLTLNKAMGVSGSAGGNGMLTFAGTISGPGQLQLGTSVFGASGSIGIAGANPNWSGGVLMNTGFNGSTITGVLAVGADTSLGTGTLTLGTSAGLLRADNGPRTLANAIDVAPTSGTTVNFGSTGVNNLTLAGNVNGAVISPTTLALNSISRGQTTFSGTIANGAAANLGITKNGPGVVGFTGNNSYTGDTIVNAGTMVLGHANALGFGGRQGAVNVAGAATVNSGAVLDLGGQANVNKPITLNGGSLVNNAGTAASVSGGTLSSLTMTANGGALSAVPTITLTGGGGNGAAATASLGLTQASLVFTPLTNGGSGYTSVPTVNITGGGGAGAAATGTLGLTAASFTITNGGSGYTTAPSVSISGGGGSGATATATISGGVVTGITITNPGTGYLFTPTISFGAPSAGTRATGVGNATNFQVGSVTLTNPGGGYASAPSVAFVGGTAGTAAAASANATNFALGLVVTNPGSGYTSAPTVGFSGGTATATANLSSVVLAATSGVGGSGDLTVNAPISGAGGLTKVGGGTLTLTAANTYAGGTTVGVGTLLVNNTTGSGTGTGSAAVTGTGTAGSGGRLGGTGFIGGNVAVGGTTAATRGGTIAPGVGSAIGTLTQTAGTMTWNPGGTYAFKYDASAPTGDLIAGTGTASLNLSGLGTGSGQQFNLALSNTTGSVSPTPVAYTVATFAGGITPPTGAGGTDLTSYFAFSGDYLGSPTATLNGNNLVVTFQPVPEPSTVLLIAAGGTAVAGLWRRRRSSSCPVL
jgi:autotransporter-associated beta strand protein